MESDGGQLRERSAVYGPCWPAWSRAEGCARLAEYVAPLATKGLGLTVTVEGEPGRSPAELELLRGERLYELLREKGIGYGWEPRVPSESVQQVRDPRWLLEDKLGTCLDLATTYASMCMEAHVDILLAVIHGHAFVVLTPGRLGANPDPTAKFEVDDFEEVQFGVTEGNMSGLLRASEAGLVAPVEATWVTHSLVGFGPASKFGPDGNRAWDGGKRVLLVDVPMLHATGAVVPLAPPEGRPTIRRYVPSGRGNFKHYEGDKGVIESLGAATGSSVLLAQAGQGKSMIARHLVEEAPFGAAWFLDASEPQALINSLAAARLAEENRSGETPDAAGRVALAHAALARLREAEGPWLVVLDNADGDPTKLRKWIPKPEEKQHVLVTTTNPDWSLVPDFEVHTLPDLADAELDKLGSGELSLLVDGRRLLFEAFRQLQESAERTGHEIAARASAVDVEDEKLRGPAVFWAALMDSPGFGKRELKLSAVASYLPPDCQPIPLLEQLVDRADEALSLLEGRGLIARDEDTESIRMHRLFSSAIRLRLDRQSSELREDVVYQLTTVEEALAVLDRYGDLATVGRLDDRLAAVDAEVAEPDERLGIAMHGVARLLERHAQTRRSGESFARAERHLADQPKLIADCLHGRARTVNQHHAREEGMLRQAVVWARSARQLLIDTEGEDANADRCLAMEGLLTKALARFPAPDETRVDVLNRALALLEDADERRSGRADISEEERARSLFNLAGIRVDLAQGEPDRASEYLDRANEIYGKVGAWRRRLYGCDVHPHIAACEIGLAYVDYYRAILVPASRAQRSLWLRSSTDYAVAALKQWETLEGSVDVEEAPKCARFLSKVALARHASPAAVAKAPRNVFNEAMKELTSARIVFESAPSLPAGAEGLVPAIDGWARSVALDELVREFGDEAPKGGDLAGLLDWLKEFSARWDYRAGRERNLVTAPQFEPVTEKVVLATAASLGLIKGGAAPAGEYDHVLILGGLARACLARPLHAAKLIGDGAIEAASITAVGGYRELKGDELGMVGSITGDDVADEFDAMDAGVRLAFGIGAPSAERGEQSEVVGKGWRVREYVAEGGVPVQVAAAPSSEPGKRRANTPDTVEWFAAELARLRSGQRVLAITSDIYVPYQHADALRMMALPYGVEVETAGIQPGDLDPRLSQVFRPHAYLQEVRSTILALNRLLAAVPTE